MASHQALENFGGVVLCGASVSGKRVLYRESAEAAAVLEIFGDEPAGACVDGRLDDQRVPE